MINNLLIGQIEKELNEKIHEIKEIKSGYSRSVFLLNGTYYLKISVSSNKDLKNKIEVDFLKNSNLDFVPKIIYSDFTKNVFPFAYHVEKKINGDSLLLKWPTFTEDEKKQLLNNLIHKTEVIHSFSQGVPSNQSCLKSLINEFDCFLDKNNYLGNDRINYLKKLREIIPTLFKDAKTGLIHNDLHFNNILIDNSKKIYFIDFEEIGEAFVEREYDPINRMSRCPKIYNFEPDIYLNPADFKDIIKYIYNYSNEVSKDNFFDRLLFFDCLHSMKWLPLYPKHEIYNDVLFNKSKKLLL